MMARANIPEDIRYKVWTAAFKTATLLDGLLPIEMGGVTASRYLHWCGKNPGFAKHLRTWGEAGTVKTKTDTTPKVKDRGIPCMFVGCALDHPEDTYRMWNPETGGVHQTRDAIWMKRMFYEKKNRPNEIITQHDDIIFKAPAIPEAGKGDVAEAETVVEETENEAAIEETENEPRRSERTSQPTQRLIEEATLHAAKYEVALTQAEIKHYAAMQQFPEGESAPGELACVGAGIGGGFVNTKELHVMKYDQAINGPDKEKWKQAVQEEHERMVTHGVFKTVPKDEVPIGAKVLSSAWAMKKKANGTCRARLNARGYEQIDGEHYDENEKFAPVVSDVAIHIVLIMIAMTHYKME
jgi:hypothetical protein